LIYGVVKNSRRDVIENGFVTTAQNLDLDWHCVVFSLTAESVIRTKTVHG
jgi:hypothetical protein